MLLLNLSGNWQNLFGWTINFAGTLAVHLGTIFDDFTLKHNILVKFCVMTCHCIGEFSESVCKLQHKTVTVILLKTLSAFIHFVSFDPVHSKLHKAICMFDCHKIEIYNSVNSRHTFPNILNYLNDPLKNCSKFIHLSETFCY